MFDILQGAGIDLGINRQGLLNTERETGQRGRAQSSFAAA